MTDVPSDPSQEMQTAFRNLRLGDILHESSTTQLLLAQPPMGSPAGIVISDRGRPDHFEGSRQIMQSIAAGAVASHPNLIALLDHDNIQSAYLVMPRLEGESCNITESEIKTVGGGSADPTGCPGFGWPSLYGLFTESGRQLCHWPRTCHPGRSRVASRIHTVSGHHYRGTPKYASPESLAGNLAAIPAMDIFSLGRVLWHCLTRTEPVSQFLLEPVADLVQQMVAKDPDERPAAADVVQHLLQLEIETLGRHIGPATSNNDTVTRHRAA